MCVHVGMRVRDRAVEWGRQNTPMPAGPHVSCFRFGQGRAGVPAASVCVRVCVLTRGPEATL